VIRPVRIQLSRAKGFNLQRESRAINGLPAINCARPGAWGNQYIVGQGPAPGWSASEVVDLYGNSMDGHWPNFYRAGLLCLPGHNLACYCGLFEPCHVDILLSVFGIIEVDDWQGMARQGSARLGTVGSGVAGKAKAAGRL
jgi:hypothetical protein